MTNECFWTRRHVLTLLKGNSSTRSSSLMFHYLWEKTKTKCKLKFLRNKNKSFLHAGSALPHDFDKTTVPPLPQTHTEAENKNNLLLLTTQKLFFKKIISTSKSAICHSRCFTSTSNTAISTGRPRCKRSLTRLLESNHKLNFKNRNVNYDTI